MKQHFKSVLAIIFLIILGIKSLMIPMIYLDFELRRDYISRNLCENRNRPQLNCDGKCYLAKKIAAAQEQEERQAECDYMGKLIEVVAGYPIFESVMAPTASIDLLAALLPTPYKNALAAQAVSKGIFHPPII